MKVYRTDLDKAKEFMAKTEKPEGGFTLKMFHVSGLEQQASLGTDHARQPQAAEHRPGDPAAELAGHGRGLPVAGNLPDLFPVYQTANYGDPDNIAFAAYHSSRNGGWQNAVYHNPEVDALIEAARSEIDPAKRIAIYGDFQKKVVEDAPDIFGVLERRKLGMRDSVKDWHFTPVASNAIEVWPLSL